MVSGLRIIALVVAVPALIAAVHPIHAARVELVAVRNGDVAATVRVYEEDFAPGRDFRAISAYFDRHVILTAANGSRVLLRPVTTTTEGDRLRIVLVGWTRTPLSGGKLQVTLLHEKFDDQVNVVDTRNAGGKQQLVYLRGDDAQLLN